MLKIISLKSKIQKMLILFVLSIFCLILSVFFVITFKSNEKPDTITNINIEELFPVIKFDKNLSDSDIKYIDKNFKFIEYSLGSNKNLNFIVPIIKFLTIEADIQSNDFTNNLYKIFDSKNNELEGKIVFSNIGIELNASDFNEYYCLNILNMKPLRTKTEQFIDGYSSDIIAKNNLGEIVRIKTFKNSNYFYTIYFKFSSLKEYLKYAKDISIIFNGFKLINPLEKINTIKWKKITFSEKPVFEFLLPFDSKMIAGKNLIDNYIYFVINKKDQTANFEIKIYDDINIKSKRLIEHDFDILNKNNCNIQNSTEKIEYFDTKKDDILYKINYQCVNKKDITIYYKILTTNNKKIFSKVHTINEEDDFLLYRENLRFLDIITNSLKTSFFENKKLLDTNWKYFIE